MTWILIAILFVHFLADFVFQTDWMAKNKSKSWKALATHILEYTFVLATGCLLLFLIGTISGQATIFVITNGAAHFLIDAVTSRLTSYYWSKQQAHNFFVVVGFDQFLHAALLVWSAQYFGLFA